MKSADPIRDVRIIETLKSYFKSWNDKYYILFCLGINTGLRVSDLRCLKVYNIENDYIRISEQKTGKSKKFLLNPVTRNEVLNYIQKNHLAPSDYVIQSRNGQNSPLSRQRIYDILQKASDELNLSQNMILSPHSLRKTFGYHFYKRTNDIAMLMSIFNHSSPSITLRYIGISDEMIDNTLKGFYL